MNPFIWATSFLFFSALTSGDKITTGRFYQIKSFDGSLLTVGGDETAGVKIVTEDLRGTDPRQAFWVGDGADSHLLSPQKQNSFSTLVLGMDSEKKDGVFQQSHRYLATHQWWRIQDLGNNKWCIQNVRTGFCVSTVGKTTQPFGVLCDKSSVNQTWEFAPISRLGKLLTSELV